MENRFEKQIVSSFILPILTLCLFLLIGIGCFNHTEKQNCYTIDDSILQEGDLVFRLGRGLSSQIVTIADSRGAYSHVGFLVKDTVGWWVIHAVPEESDETGGKEVMKRDALAHFFGDDRTAAGAIFRYDSIQKIKYSVIHKATQTYNREPLFDNSYKLSDTTSLYCTEFVYRIFMSAGIDLSEGRRHSFPLADENIIFPSDILNNKALKEVIRFRYDN